MPHVAGCCSIHEDGSEALFLSSSPVISSNDMPVINETYEGISGRTQGETKDKRPAVKATKKEIFPVTSIFISLT